MYLARKAYRMNLRNWSGKKPGQMLWKQLYFDPRNDEFTCNELRERLGTYDIITVMHQNRLRWCGHVSRKNEKDWVKNAWITKWKVYELEVDERKPGVRLSDKTVRPHN